MLLIPMLSLKDICRFWEYVKRTDYCWIWVGGYIGSGSKSNDNRESPCFTIGNKNYVATRIMWKIIHNVDPGDKLVCHSCDNRSCVKADHLWLGTHSENSQDCFSKGRGQTGNNRKVQEHTYPLVTKLRNDGLSQQEIADKLNVDQTTISRILQRIGA